MIFPASTGFFINADPSPLFTIFGAAIAEMLHVTPLYNIVAYLSVPIMFLAMCTAFTIIYAFVEKFGKANWKERVRQHYPGAIFTTVCWQLFSYGFAMYIRYFPSASAIYGSMTAVCLLMLWIYVCVIILLLGAEINKIILRNKGLLIKNPETDGKLC